MNGGVREDRGIQDRVSKCIPIGIRAQESRIVFTRTKMSTTNPLELERQLADKAEELKDARKVAANARATANSLKKKAPLFLASLKNNLKFGDSTITEEALKRKADGSQAYKEVIEGVCEAETKAMQLEADVEGLKDQFDAIRSALSYEKALIQEKIYNHGGR